jgi:hypothetical protein
VSNHTTTYFSGLTESQVSKIFTSAHALQGPDRVVFLDRINRELAGRRDVGDGELHRLLRDVQGDVLRSRPVIHTGSYGKYSRHLSTPRAGR